MPNVVRVVSQDKVLRIVTAGATRSGAVSLAHSDLTGLTTGDPHTQYLLDAAADIIVKLGSDVVNNNGVANTIASVTGLAFPVVSGTTYKFKFFIRYDAAATTTGSRWSVTGPTTTVLSYRSDYSLTATSRTQNEGLAAYDLPAASNASSAATSNNIALIEGIITPSANGNVTARFASEVLSSAITAKAESYVEYRVI